MPAKLTKVQGLALALFLIAGALLVLPRLSHAVGCTNTWDGGGGDTNWANAKNWQNDQLPATPDRAWELLGANRAVSLLTAGVAPELLEPPANVLRLALHPDGVAPRIANLGEWRGHLLDRLERQIALTGDPALAALLDEVSAYPGPQREGASEPEIAVPLRLRTELGELSFISTVATFGTAVEVTASELSIESFFPADAATAEALRRLAVPFPK